MVELESILDAPRDGLDPEVWKVGDDGETELTDVARTRIQQLVDYVCRTFGIDDPQVRIVGSITSNQYSDGSDIDVHITFDGLTEENADDMNKVLRAEFEENYKDIHTGEAQVGSHPLEVYFQANPFQDMMSVGCYDFTGRRWLVGPELKPADYDPYADLFSDDMEYVEGILEDVRDVVLRCRELAVAIVDSNDEQFRDGAFESLKAAISEAAGVFRTARDSRKAYSSPRSGEDALRMRGSREWKVADSAFKMMDRFGYIGVLRVLANIDEKIGMYSAEEAAEATLAAIRDKMQLKESVGESLKGFGISMIIASLLWIPGILSKEALAKGISDVPSSRLRMGGAAV